MKFIYWIDIQCRNLLDHVYKKVFERKAESKNKSNNYTS
jgi:hypothetical protein